MKNTFWKRERIEIMIALALFNYVFLGAEYLFDNMMDGLVMQAKQVAMEISLKMGMNSY